MQGLTGPRGTPGPQGNPGVSEIHVLAGAIGGTISGVQSGWLAIGPSFLVTTNNTQRLSGVAIAGMGLQNGSDPQSVGVGLCYQSLDDNSITNFAGGSYTEYMMPSIRLPFFCFGIRPARTRDVESVYVRTQQRRRGHH
jgi:hypothetical protein